MKTTPTETAESLAGLWIEAEATQTGGGHRLAKVGNEGIILIGYTDWEDGDTPFLAVEEVKRGPWGDISGVFEQLALEEENRCDRPRLGWSGPRLEWADPRELGDDPRLDMPSRRLCAAFTAVELVTMMAGSSILIVIAISAKMAGVLP